MINTTQGKKIVIFKGIIDSLDAFAEELYTGFTESGCDVLMVDVNDLRCYEDEAFKKIEDYVSCKDACCIFMNNIGMLMADVSGGNYWNRSGVRCFDILADPPFFYHNAIESDIENVTFVCVDKEQSDYINRYYGKGSDYNKRTGRTRKSLYMPLAGVEIKSPGKGIIPLNKRRYDVVFTGNIRDYEDIDTETAGMAESLLQLWDAVYEQIINDTSLTIERAVHVCMQKYSLELSDDFVHQIILLFKRMDSVIRAKYRAEVIRTLVDNGVKVDVFGDGWELIKVKHPENLIIHEKVSYMESVELMKDVKISLNVMPWFKQGFHDRIATAMLAGCISVTDSSEYIKQKYIDGTDIIIYDLDCLTSLPNKINNILKNINISEKTEKIEQTAQKEQSDSLICKVQRIAENGRLKALKQDTWKQRAEWFLKVMEN